MPVLEKNRPSTRHVIVKCQNTECHPTASREKNSNKRKNRESEGHQTSPQKSHGKLKALQSHPHLWGTISRQRTGQQAPERVQDDTDRIPGDAHGNGGIEWLELVTVT